MSEENFYNQIPEEKKRDIAFNIVAMVREAVSIANKNPTPPTYEQALSITHDIDENLYKFCSTQLQNKAENDIAKLYKEMAEAETELQGKKVLPETLLSEEIAKQRKYLAAPNLERKRMKFLKNHISSLEAALENLKPRRLTEHRILERDFCKVDRSALGAEKFFEKDGYIDYKVSNDRFLRLRMFHPDKAEHIIGADLVYEFYNVEDETVRIMVLQYKVWEDGVLYFSSSGNMEKQLLKLKSIFCDSGFCTQPSALAESIDYRFPYCCAFLRPTDRIQKPDSKMISSGVHIPACSAMQIKTDHAGKIEKSQIRHTALTHEIFEYLFNHNFIGSRFIPYTRLEDYYKSLTVFEKEDTIRLYAKEILAKKIIPSS